MRKRSVFKTLRAIAFVAIACTIAVTVFMLVEAAAPADRSSALSSKFSGENGEAIVVSGRGDKIPTTGLRLKYGAHYAGTTCEPTLTFIPEESTDREVVWEVVNESDLSENGEHCITLDSENGELSFKHLGTLTVKVSLKSDPSISAKCTASCLGTHPRDITSLKLNKTEFLQGEIAALRLEDQNGELVSIDGMNISYSDGGEHFTVENNLLCPKKVGSSTLTISHKKLSKQYSFEVTVKENAKYIPLENILPNESKVADGQTYFVKPNVKTDIRQLISCLPAGSSKFQTYSYTIQNPDDKDVIERDGTNFFHSVATGEAKLTITSSMAPSISVTLNIKVYIDKPDALRIITSDIIVVDRVYSIKTFGSEFYIDDVDYTAIEGKARFSKGKFRPTRLGKLVIRATYKEDPSLYTDIVLDVKLYDTFSSFIRKALGHFSLFALIGFGFTYVYIFLFKRKWIGAPLSVPTGLLLAMASEGLQLTAEGRYGSWTDVFVDWVGFMLGALIAWVMLGLIFLIARFFKGYGEFKAGYAAVSAKTLFMPADKACAADDDKKTDSGEVSSPPPDVGDGAIENKEIENNAIGDGAIGDGENAENERVAADVCGENDEKNSTEEG